MSSDPNSEDFDWNDFIFDNNYVPPRGPVLRITSETARQKAGLKPSSPMWNTGMLQKSIRPTLSGGSVIEVTASPLPDSFERALNDCTSEYHM